MKIVIKKRYLYIYLAVIIAFSAFYIILFVINRMQYLDRSLQFEREMMSKELFLQTSLNNLSNKNQLQYFINYAHILEYFYINNRNVLTSLIKKDVLYDFIAIVDKNNQYNITNNTKFNILNTNEIKNQRHIKTMFAFNDVSKKTYYILIYPIMINNVPDSHIIAYLDISDLLNDNVFLVAQDGSLMSAASNINMIYKNLAFEYPSEWEDIISSNEGQFISPNAVFTYQALDSNVAFAGATIESDKYYLVSIAPINPNDSPYFVNNVSSFMKYIDFTTNIIYWIIGYIWILCTSVILLMVIVDRMKNDELSQFDDLTGAYNRHKGYIRIKKLIERFSNTKEHLSHIFTSLLFFKKLLSSIHFCMVDIDGLKQVNDKLGHKYGDEMIITVVNTINKGLRNNEFVIRIGGDEFLIVFINRDFDSIYKYWDYVYQEFINKNSNNTKYTIKVSHGVVEYKVNDDINACIMAADELMYKEKRRHKVNLFFN